MLVHSVWNVGHVHVTPDREIVGVSAVKGVEVDGGWRTKVQKGKPVKVTLDSGAGASCWPEKLLRSAPLQPKTKGVRFAAANGTELRYLGNKDVKFVPRNRISKEGAEVREGACNLRFHVTDTTKPLASAMAVVRMGNRVVLDSEGSYIENKMSGERIQLQETGGTYTFDIDPLPISQQQQRQPQSPAETSDFRRQG